MKSRTMRVFTFSGISPTLKDLNDGSGLRRFAFDFLEATKASAKEAYDYFGMENVDHFRSDINFGSILSTLDGAITLDGSSALDAEGRQFAVNYAQRIKDTLGMKPEKEDVLFLAHSQGCNNCTFTLRRLIETAPDLFDGRQLRAIFFDPKVGANNFRPLFTWRDPKDFPFLFAQSDEDLLGNQAIFAGKFIDQFQLGDHWWIRGLNHTSIREWKSYTTSQEFLTRLEYFEFKHACDKKLVAIQKAGGKAGINTTGMGEFQKFQKNYKMPGALLGTPLTQFAWTGKFAAKASAANKFIS